MNLTYNAVQRMIEQGEGSGESMIVQARDLKYADQKTLKFVISDSQNENRAVIWTDEPSKCINKVCKEIDGKYVINILSWQCHTGKGKVMIQVKQFQPVQPPAPKKKENIPSADNNINLKKNNPSRKPIEPVDLQPLNIRENARLDNEQQDMDDDRLRQFEKISDLYVDFQGRWQIVVRVLEKNYKQFTNRAGKLTKIFEMTLTDRTGMKIGGVMFGDSAREYHDLITEDRVYRMSKGQIKEETYKQRGNQYSKYNIVFNSSSQFIPIHQISSIPRKNQKIETINQVIEQNNFENSYNIVVILLEIGEEKIIQKQDREIYKRNIVIGDPQTKKAIQVVIWKKQLKIDEAWLDKTVLLKNFKLHSYKQTLSLSSTFRSDIVHNYKHKFNRYQGKYLKSQYDFVSESGPTQSDKNNQNKDKTSKTIRDLEADLAFAKNSQTIYTDLQVWLSHASFKGKWFYSACNNPKCKRAAEISSKCIYCGHYNEYTKKKFILPIQLSDSTASLWVTAFDQFAQEIFSGLNIEDLALMTQQQLKEVSETRCYRQYKLRISSKKQADGNTKHAIVGKITEINVAKQTASNIDKIKAILGQN